MVTEDPSPPIPYALDPYPSTVNEAMSETMMVPVVLKAEETVPCICDPAPPPGPILGPGEGLRQEFPAPYD